ncbi:hypothetical protein B0W47_11080 [Komagataeibacter nataicola]|uniref:Uncharacterized protein n=1 Tax=Komagataeibacter nataicola TaxID=265960 RepID=A0A9N7CVN1_9PROT|nr:hypothetical protein [Komagataeibacter nataicola]AQU87925.1 hypothetical protein B0W47_11080 [Komagataeibacter nataicola]PYD66455.1 hypothetical protein CDI09_08130 [Komagataeibacter nataicola]WEQ55638.1 hypothetical protein LV564_16485 [Komagataeibacter nataicola]GBR26530.1 hypothetical protein AA0616_3237 [Komagataeibacter nataicola NRIC 0616]
MPGSYLPAGCTQADIDARFAPDEPAWVARYIAQLACQLERIAAMRAELAATRFDGAYDTTDIVGYLDDEMQTLRQHMAHPLPE